MHTHPVNNLRSVLMALLDHAVFEYDQGDTRELVRKARVTLDKTAPVVAHTPPAGIFKYDPDQAAFTPVSDSEAKDVNGNLLPGYIYLFHQPPELVPH